jgi:hypothetical protein
MGRVGTHHPLPLQNPGFPENETALGARGDLDLIVKQQSLTGFDVNLTPMGTAVSYSRVPTIDCLQSLNIIDKTRPCPTNPT